MSFIFQEPTQFAYLTLAQLSRAPLTLLRSVIRSELNDGDVYLLNAMIV